MLQDERVSDELVAVQNTLEGWQRKLWTALPGIVQSAPATDGTISVQPSIMGRLRTPSGEEQDVPLPLLIKCPLMNPAGGGFTVSFPIKPGDEVLVVFASRCIDAWWQSGGVQKQLELRMHNLSDGFAVPGGRSVGNVPPNLHPDNVQLRNDAGTTFVEMTPDGDVNVETTTKIKMTAPLVEVVAPLMTLSGELQVAGLVTALHGTAEAVGLTTHVHAQGNDSHGDAEVPTDPPTGGT